MGKSNRPSSAKRGYGHDWRKFRANYLKKHPICCRQGCREPATDVDHEPPLEGPDDPGRLDEARCAPLCHAHHSQKTGLQAAAQREDDHRDKMLAVSRKKSEERREIGEIPPIENVSRREKCRSSLRSFCETYFKASLKLKWSTAHLTAIARIEEAVRQGALFAFAMPRGSGKTTICRMAALWAVAYGHCRYVYIIGATSEKGADSLDSIKTLMRYSPKFIADFPEISHPIIALKGIAHRASGQMCNGESTLIQWSKDEVVLPTVPPPENWPKKWKLREDGMVPTSGALLSVSGLTAEGIRGSLKTLMTGEFIRPDLVLLDDPQTHESACSVAQNAKRLSLISNDVLGMAGPGSSIAGVMPCTVIARGDMVDQVLDRKKHPLWRGERTKMLASFPKNLAKWNDEYRPLWEECAQTEPPDFTRANQFYIDHQTELDEGAVATWPERKKKDEVSAIQAAMHLYFRDRFGFMSEYQNDPVDISMEAGARRLDAEAVGKRRTGLPALLVPRECMMVTTFIDPGGYLHWYITVAWTAGFGGSIIDYGCWPRQPSPTFTKDDTMRNLANRFPGKSRAAYVYDGLMELCSEILTRKYQQDVTGAIMMNDRVLIDSGFETQVVYEFIRANSHFPGSILPSKGIARATDKSPISQWKPRPGEQTGENWRKTVSETKRGMMIQFDTDAWKSFVYDRLDEHVSGRTSLKIYGDLHTDHRLLAGHLAAEFGTMEPCRGVVFEKWRPVENSGTDNDWFDCLTGAAVAASVAGLKWSAGGRVEPAARKPISLKELQEQRRREKQTQQGVRA